MRHPVLRLRFDLDAEELIESRSDSPGHEFHVLFFVRLPPEHIIAIRHWDVNLNVGGPRSSA